MKTRRLTAIDLFCGVGGLSFGLKEAGVDVKAGVDMDPSCRYAYEHNCKAAFLNQDIRKLTRKNLTPFWDGSDYRALVGCAPCQPFSSHTYKRKQANHDRRWYLIGELLRLVKECRPHIVSMENVPNLVNQKIFADFVDGLKSMGYHVSHSIVSCCKYGVPQTRRRLVLLASQFNRISLAPPDINQKEQTVRDAIGHLPAIKHDASGKKDGLHVCSKLTGINLKRIKASKPGDNWLSWPKRLLPECYKKNSGATYKNVYGRMAWDKPAPTLTTQFIRYGTGRFGHPEQDRAISLREGALLQTFPESFAFYPKRSMVKLGQTAQHIGNAVPPLLAKHIGQSIVNCVKGHEGLL